MKHFFYKFECYFRAMETHLSNAIQHTEKIKQAFGKNSGEYVDAVYSQGKKQGEVDALHHIEELIEQYGTPEMIETLRANYKTA